jgi:hypothetical protein
MASWKTARLMARLMAQGLKCEKKTLVGVIPTPLKNIKVSWEYYSQYMEK